MTIISIDPTFPIFGEADGTPLESGFVYIGMPNLNPEVVANQVTVYWDFAQTIPATQPIRTTGGRPVRGTNAARFYYDGDYSMTVRNKNSALVYSEGSHLETQAAASQSEWLATGASGSFISATSFSVIGDQTITYAIDRRVKIVDSGGTKYVTIISSVFSTVTTIVVKGDALAATITDVAVGLLSATNDAVPRIARMHTEGAAIASATTTDIQASTGDTVHITGTVTITGLGTANRAGVARNLVFDGALTLTNSASLILPSGANITTSAGDTCVAISEDAAGAWRVHSYAPATGRAAYNPDASTTVKGVVELATDAETVTGTDAVRATTPASVTAKMSAPGAIGDTTPSTGSFTDLTATGTVTGIPGVVQIVTASTATSTSSSTNTYIDSNLTATITPTSASNKILVIVNQNGLRKVNDTAVSVKLLRGATSLLTFSQFAGYTADAATNAVGGVGCTYVDSPATTSATTYKTQFMSVSNIAQVHVQVNSDASTITLIEVTP
ncbi:MAG: hypothetical protein ABUJ92_00550 [Desulfobacterales bacterium]